MRSIDLITLISIVFLVSGAFAQGIFTGEGYSSTQLSYFNGPSTMSFDPFVEKYWGNYVQNANVTPGSEVLDTDLKIWMNSFPLAFDNPAVLKSSTFVESPEVQSYSSSEWASMNLKRSTLSNFNIDMAWKYTPIYSPADVQKTSFSLNENMTAPASGSSGQILAQSIKSLFNV